MANVSSQTGLNIFVRTHTCYLSFAIAVETVTLWSGTYEEVPDGHKAYTKGKPIPNSYFSIFVLGLVKEQLLFDRRFHLITMTIKSKMVIVIKTGCCAVLSGESEQGA